MHVVEVLRGGKYVPLLHPCKKSQATSQKRFLERWTRRKYRIVKLWRSREVCALIDITHRQLHFWTGTGLVTCEKVGHNHWYHPDQVRKIRIIKQFLYTGISLQEIRRIGWIPYQGYMAYHQQEFVYLFDDRQLLAFTSSAKTAYALARIINDNSTSSSVQL